MRLTWELVMALCLVTNLDATTQDQVLVIGDLDLSLFPELGVEFPFYISLPKECIRSFDCWSRAAFSDNDKSVETVCSFTSTCSNWCWMWPLSASICCFRSHTWASSAVSLWDCFIAASSDTDSNVGLTPVFNWTGIGWLHELDVVVDDGVSSPSLPSFCAPLSLPATNVGVIFGAASSLVKRTSAPLTSSVLVGGSVSAPTIMSPFARFFNILNPHFNSWEISCSEPWCKFFGMPCSRKCFGVLTGFGL